MRAKIKSTGEIVHILKQSVGGSYYDVLYPYGFTSKSGHKGDIRTIGKSKLQLLKKTDGLNQEITNESGK